ncbi:MAG: acylphosphatase [Halanaerobiales bacterium]|nr:acylphosphatase [Halanaerobiales bacterium]
MTEEVRKHVYISGRVQGVGFRHFVLTKARELGLKGWVRNLYDGRVEAVFVGNKNDVEQMLKLIKKGPRWARVDNVRVLNEEIKDEFDTFQVRF